MGTKYIFMKTKFTHTRTGRGCCFAGQRKQVIKTKGTNEETEKNISENKISKSKPTACVKVK